MAKALLLKIMTVNLVKETQLDVFLRIILFTKHVFAQYFIFITS